MTGRERLEAVLSKQPTDRLPWTTLVDRTSLDRFPPELQGNCGIDFYRHLGCDIFMLSGWGTPHPLRSPVHVWGPDVRVEHSQEGRTVTTTWHTPHGELTAVRQGGHPQKYPVDTLEAVRTCRAMWEGARFEAFDDAPALEAIDRLIGDDGVVTRFWGPSAIPRLLEVDMGTVNFYYLNEDHPAEVDGLIRTIHERELDAFRLLAEGPWSSATLVENTSTYYISPDIYRRYNMPHQRDFVEAMHGAGKPAIIHMCGHVHGILDIIKETGCDGIHFLTPAPTGDTPWEEALDVLGENLIIFGCLDPSIFVSGKLEAIAPALDTLITPRLREANFVLSPTADGLPVGLDRFLAVKAWVDATQAP